MRESLARAVNVMLAGMLTGNELGTWRVVHPAIESLGPDQRIQAEQAITRDYGRVMPFAMSGTLLSYLPVLALDGGVASRRGRLTLAGMGCYAAMLGVTLTRNMAINARLLELAPDDHAEFAELRARWDRLHAVRNALNLCALVLTVAGALTPRSTLSGWGPLRRYR